MRGYKAFDSSLKCRGFQFEVGQSYSLGGYLKICNNGFHFCLKLNDVFQYYPVSYDTRICEIEALSEVQTKENKSCTLNIKIIRELSKEEVKVLTDDLKFNSGDHNSGLYNSGDHNSGLYNSGDHNSGLYNSGDHNSGHRNSGHRNSGNRNSGDHNSGLYNSGDHNSGDHNSGDHNSGHYNSGLYNSGHRNSGHRNSGHRNSGNRNSGHHNSGDHNSGHYNSGLYNSGHRNSGFFNTNTPKVRLFNKYTDLDFDSNVIQKLRCLNVKPILQWVYDSSMTDEEKNNYPSYKTTGGYLKNTGKQDWSNLTESDKELIMSLPGYDDKIFQKITGISLIKGIK